MVWAAGDVRIRGFDLDTHQAVDTLYVRKDLILRSGIAVWGDFVVLGTGRELYRWDKRITETNSQRLPSEEGLYAEMIHSNGLNPKLVNWTKGRPPDGVLTVSLDGDITSICAIGEYLAVASKFYPVIHVYNFDNPEVVVVRLIGHTMGVTMLRGYEVKNRPKHMFSGSADKTIKLWNLTNGVCVMHFERHGGKVTSIAHTKLGSFTQISSTRYGRFLFTGGKDCLVRAWDVRKPAAMFLLEVSDKMTPVALSLKPVDDEYCEVAIMAVGAKSTHRIAIGRPAQLLVYRFYGRDGVSEV
jgi:WD40 repeat protein